VAQYDTPFPVNSSSPFMPSLLCMAPVAIITVFDFISVPSASFKLKIPSAQKIIYAYVKIF